MYDYRPPRQNAKARYLVLGLFVAALVALFGSQFVPKFPFLLQVVGLSLFIPVIQLSTRYVFTSYLYRLHTHEQGDTDLEIYAYRGGARMQLVCRVGLSEITAAAPLTEANKKPPRRMRRYNYCMDISPRDALVLSITNGDGDCELLLCPDHVLREAFASHTEKAEEQGDGK